MKDLEKIKLKIQTRNYVKRIKFQYEFRYKRKLLFFNPSISLEFWYYIIKFESKLEG